MKISISNEELNKGVQIVSRAISQKSVIDALTGVYVEANKEGILLRGTDLEIGIECYLEGIVEEEGKAVIPARNFADLVRKLPSTALKMELKENIINIEYLNSLLTFNTFNPEEYSFLVNEDSYSYIEIKKDTLKEMIKKVSIALSQDEGRPVFTGIYMEKKEENRIRMVATDTHRMAIKDSEVDKAEDTGKAIIPGRALAEVSRIIDKIENDIIKIGIGNNQAVFELEGIKVKVRLIEGQFPAYEGVIPTEYITTLKLNTALFNDIIERAYLIAHSDTFGGSNIIKMMIEDTKLVVDSRAPDLGSIHEEMEVGCEGENLEIAFNGRYLVDVLKVLEDEEITAKLSGPVSPAVFSGIKNDYLYLILPLRV